MNDPIPPDFASEMRKAQEEYRGGRIQEAAARIDKLRLRAPDRPEILAAYGIIQIARGDPSSAYEAFSQALERQPNEPETLSWAALTAYNLQRFIDAERHARRLIAVAPTRHRGYYLLANALRSQDRIEEALIEIDRALDLKADDTESLVTKARLARSATMPGLAVDLYQKAMSIRPTPSAGVELAEIFLRDTHPEEALQTLKEVSLVLPRPKRPYTLIAEALMQLRQFEEAEENWKLALELASHPFTVVQARAKAEIASGRFQNAESLLVDLIEQGEDLAGSFSLLSTGKKMKAVDLPLIQRAAEIPLESLDVAKRIELCYALGKSFDDIGDYERAMQNYDAANRICLETYVRRRSFDREQMRAFSDYLIRLSVPKPASTGLESDLPLFVVGMMRSGTTLTENILSAHSKVKGWGEQAFWSDRIVEFITRDSKGNFHYDHDLVLRLAKEFLQALDPQAPSIRYVIDKNPGNYKHVGILHSALPNATFIHLIRHPVDNLLSIWMTPMSASVSFASDRSNLVFTYREHMRLMEHWKAVLPSDRLRSYRYEDLTSEPDGTIGSMLDYLALDREEPCFSPEKNERFVQTPSVYQVRQPIHRGSQGRWKNYQPWLGEFAELLDEAE